MVFDNRFFPLYVKPYTQRPCLFSRFRFQPFIMHAEHAQGDFDEVPIPDIFGKYNLVDIVTSMRNAGILTTNPFRSDLQGLTNIPFSREGRLDAQGISFYFEQPLSNSLLLGLNFLFMHINSRFEFCLDQTCVITGPGDRNYLFCLKEQLNEKLCLSPALFCKTVFGDTDLYFRYGHMWPYTFKFRTLDVGLRTGILIPSAPKVLLDNPASVPAGGNGHWGAYVQLENQYEVKEDIFARIMFRASKRFKRTQLSRIPVTIEPSNYGVLTGPLEINPGWTFVFNPSFTLEGIREGLGVSLLYTLVAHLKDTICDKRVDKSIEVNLEPIIRRSSWGMEYVTVGIFYDFAKFKECPRVFPTVSLYWDIPVDWSVSERSVKTHSVSLMVDIAF